MFLWLWCRPEAIALIQPLAWEPPYATGVTLKSRRKKKKEEEEEERKKEKEFEGRNGTKPHINMSTQIPHTSKPRPPPEALSPSARISWISRLAISMHSPVEGLHTSLMVEYSLKAGEMYRNMYIAQKN